MKIDAHQHFWNYSEKEYAWIPTNIPLHRDWLPADLAPLPKAASLDGCIAAQARESVEESRLLLDRSNHNPIIKEVVDWVDLQSDKVEESLGELSVHPRFAGVRHVVQQLSGQPFVVDHIAKPFIKDGKLSPWKEQIQDLAKSKNISRKVPGMVREAKPDAWQKEDFHPYRDIVFEAFGGDRPMFGFGWPVCLLSGTYPPVHGLVGDYTEKLPTAARVKIFGENCSKFHGVK